jgi:predicted TIM-barrel enzyme
MARREEVLRRLAAKRAAGIAIIGAGAGAGISAKFLHKGGADLIFVYKSGRFRMQGLSSWAGHLPFGDANAIVMEMGEREVLPIAPEAHVVAGVCGVDPTRRMSHFLPKIVEAGFVGVINYPTVAVIDGRMRADLEAGELGFEKEVAMIAIARALGLLTTAYVCTPDEAKAMVNAGVDVIVAHMGLTSGGAIGARRPRAMADVAKGVATIAVASREIRKDVFVLAHGGPIATSADAAELFRLVEVDGFVGASSMERLPIEEPLRATTFAFTQLRTRT